MRGHVAKRCGNFGRIVVGIRVVKHRCVRAVRIGGAFRVAPHRLRIQMAITKGVGSIVFGFITRRVDPQSGIYVPRPTVRAGGADLGAGSVAVTRFATTWVALTSRNTYIFVVASVAFFKSAV